MTANALAWLDKIRLTFSRHNLQGDLAACVQEMVKSHKVYAEEEKQAQEIRLKTMTTEEK